MKNLAKIVISAVVFSFVVTAGCMRYTSDKTYERGAVEIITETGDDGSKTITYAALREWGGGAGEDAIYGTLDDDLSGYLKIDLDAQARPVKIASSDSPGLDKIWFSADDPVFIRVPLTAAASDFSQAFLIPFARNSKFLPIMFSTKTNNPSRDLDWAVTSLLTEPLTSRLYPQYYGNFELAGFSGASIPNIDRELVQHLVFSPNTLANIAATTTSKNTLSPGPDLIFGTSDDILESYTQLVRSGSRITLAYYYGAGTDKTWLTSDDVLGQSILLEYDALNRLISYKVAVEKGADGIPFSSDDNYLTQVSWSYAVDGTRNIVTEIRSERRASDFEGFLLVPWMTIVYVYDTALAPDVWFSPTETYTVYHGQGLSSVSHEYLTVTPDPIDAAIRSIRQMSENLSCTTIDVTAKSACVTSNPGRTLVSFTAKRIDANTIVSTDIALDGSNECCARKIIYINRKKTK